jgi:Spy/CpxP family protein refolding chaperone
MGGYGAGPMGGYGPGPMGGYGPGTMGGYGPGMMGGHGPMGGGYGPGVLADDGMPGPLGMLDLNAQQRKAIADLMGRQRSEQFERTARMRELEGKLRRLYAEPSWDADAIGNTYDQLFDLKRERIVSMVRGHNQVHGLLTEGQRRQLAAMTGGMGERQGPMGRGKGAATQPKSPGAQQ